jgi:quinol-cytochrome oxidoreductase complex cytochrome b subunit
MNRAINSYSFIRILYNNIITYPSPSNLNGWWNLGSLSLLCLVLQIITGIFLAMHYVSHEDYAFSSVEYLMREVDYGWALRYFHANGASAFFAIVYLHLFRSLYYGSFYYPRRALWAVGVIILLLMIVTAFVGYVLPWGQMSYWAATVITNLVSTIPKIGPEIVKWLWGGFSVNTHTLNRFFSIHYLMPFVILALVGLHLILLHESGSNNPLGVDFHKNDWVKFNPYYTVKDVVGVVIMLISFCILVMFTPNLTIHPDNYIRANSMVTPTHIVPEWYFLPFYAMLRAIPNKLGGVLVLLLSILILIVLPILSVPLIRSARFRPIQRIGFWLFLSNAVFLGWLGGQSVDYPFSAMAIFSTFFYFFTLIVFSLLHEFLEIEFYESQEIFFPRNK